MDGTLALRRMTFFSAKFLKNGSFQVENCKTADTIESVMKPTSVIVADNSENLPSGRVRWTTRRQIVSNVPLSPTFCRPLPLCCWRPTVCSRHLRFLEILDLWVFGSPVFAGCSCVTGGDSGAGNQLPGRGWFGGILVGRKDGMD